MSTGPVIISQHISAPVDAVWKAITDVSEMKHWYFDFESFEPVEGFKFNFISGPENGTKYLHLCEVKEVVPLQKISYSWRYDDFDGDSLVTFSLDDQGGSTVVTIIHEGIDSFATGGPDFAPKNFEAGWGELLRTNLFNYLEK